MYTTPPYVKLLIATLIALTASLILNEIDSNKQTDVDVKDYADKMQIEGYVVSKRIGEVWISDEPVSIRGMFTGFFTSNYGGSTTIVTIHENAEDKKMLRNLKINQKVRVYYDHLLESYPGRTSAYYIEIIE
ncbi:DUF3221 domain-containing protein [Bacillus canaveralius]|uniref:DUF3221 domain-containing protein n=1 Tax=Bacillus canaveralius TaxID=1403243 RepID=UPI000F7B5ADB|nr:DUF3221 domain-containing protein [Bacillus canaveralius]RSK50708.1 DUF3221 domain-containing protein [Bacillus canaveralius]